MTTKNERLIKAWHDYEKINGHSPSSARQATEWAVEQGLIQLPDIDPMDALAQDMAQALRTEYKTDRQGRRYRVNHAIRVTKNGVQQTIWGILGHAPHEHMEKSFTQRREQIIGDCHQLKTDVDAYNVIRKIDKPPVQLVLDFSDDVAEREFYIEANKAA